MSDEKLYRPGMLVEVTGPFAPMYQGVWVVKEGPTMGHVQISLAATPNGPRIMAPIGWIKESTATTVRPASVILSGRKEAQLAAQDTVVEMPGSMTEALANEIAAREIKARSRPVTADRLDRTPVDKTPEEVLARFPVTRDIPMPTCGGCGEMVERGMAGKERHAECLAREWTPEDHVKAVLSSLVKDGLDPETPARMFKGLAELCQGYKHSQVGLVAMLKAFPKEGGDGGLVIVKDLPFASLCEHHVLPFTGTVSVAYIPGERIVGLSKIPRLVRAVTRRLQVQERIGQMVGDAMNEALSPLGVMVLVRGKHTCMALRGVESPGEMVTSYLLGVLKTDATARGEALALLVR